MMGNDQSPDDKPDRSEADEFWSEFMARVYSNRKRISEEELHAHLDEAYSLYIKGETSSREGAIAALDAVIGFLQSNLFYVSKSPRLLGHLTDRQLLPLRRLLIALRALSDGVKHDEVKPERARRGATSLTKTDAEFRLLCVTATSLLEPKLGELAADHVAKRLTKLGFGKKRQDRVENPDGIGAGTVKYWQSITYDLKAQVLSGSSLSFEAWLNQQYLTVIDAAEEPSSVFIGVLAKGGSLTDAHAAFMERQANLILDQVLPALFGHFRRKK